MKERVKIDGKWTWVTNVLEKNGPKMSVIFDKGILLFWANEAEGKEEWVKVEPPKEVFFKFMLSKLSLKDLLKSSKTALYLRAHNAYDSLKKLSDDYAPQAEDLEKMGDIFFAQIRDLAKRSGQKRDILQLG